jgi:glycerol-1-phosphate dehydrogenase [NAD(P)+]
MKQYKHSNVKEFVFGEGTLVDGLNQLKNYTVATSDPPWSSIEPQLGVKPSTTHIVTSVQEDQVDAMLRSTPADTEYVVGIGGGQALDVAKYIAYSLDRPVITAPTILSTNAYVTPLSGIRKDGRVSYIGGVSPERVLVDYDVIRAAPTQLNVSGAADVLSIHTASYDWKVASEAGARAEGRSFPYDQSAAATARQIRDDIIAGADEIARVTNEGIRLLVECHVRINELCIPLGHFRPEEGSEHFLAYNAERISGHGFLHGAIVGLGITLMSELQGNESARIRGVLDRMGIDRSLSACRLSRAQLQESLQSLKNYVRDAQLWYSAIDEAALDTGMVEHLMTLARD